MENRDIQTLQTFTTNNNFSPRWVIADCSDRPCVCIANRKQFFHRHFAIFIWWIYSLAHLNKSYKSILFKFQCVRYNLHNTQCCLCCFKHPIQVWGTCSAMIVFLDNRACPERTSSNGRSYWIGLASNFNKNSKNAIDWSMIQYTAYYYV